MAAAYIQDRNGHILPYVRFEGGSIAPDSEGLAILDEAATRDTAEKP